MSGIIARLYVVALPVLRWLLPEGGVGLTQRRLEVVCVPCDVMCKAVLGCALVRVGVLRNLFTGFYVRRTF